MQLAEVKIWDTLVGAVAWDEARGLATFEYDTAYRRSGADLAPLMMPVRGPQGVYSFPELRHRAGAPGTDTYRGLPGLLADSLPDRYGSTLIDAWLAQQGRPQGSMNPVEMLCFIGTRGMGALEYAPASLPPDRNTFSVEVAQLVEMAREMLTRREHFHTDMREEAQAMREILRIGTSAGGARPKAVIAWNEKTGEVRSGQTRAPRGFTHWLLKLDGVSDIQLGASHGYGRVEMAYYLMARDCGIDMMPSRLLEEGGRAHFMTQRYDRADGDIRHHIQTLCAMRHYDYNQVTSYSYEQLFQTMRELRLDYQTAEQMFRRMVFNVVARNCDDHTKNFAFRLRQNGAWELAPAYDVCHAYQPGHQWVSQHALSIQGKRQHITRDDLLAVGASIRMKKANDAINEISAVVSRWRDYADQVRVAPKLRDEIAGTLVRV